MRPSRLSLFVSSTLPCQVREHRTGTCICELTRRVSTRSSPATGTKSQQVEELWALSRTDLSVVTWRRPIEDPVREWGQLLAYLPEIRRMIAEHGPSIVFLPSPRLGKQNVEKATGMLGQLAGELGISTQEVRDQARQIVHEELGARGQFERFGERLR